MIRYLMLILAVMLCGCAKQRAQSGADVVAGIKAARVALEAGMATQEAINILTGVEKYVPAATGVNPAEWPAPRMTPQQIVEDPAKYDADAPPVPEGWGARLWSAAILAGGLLAWATKRLLPLVPGIGGPARAMIELVADVAWKGAATKEQKALDAALLELKEAAHVANPVIEAILGSASNLLPPEIRDLLKNDDVTLALIRLSRPPVA